jgi:hypothetical protein
MTYAGAFGLPQSGELIVVGPRREQLRVSRCEFDRRRDNTADRQAKLHDLARELVALRAQKK